MRYTLEEAAKELRKTRRWLNEWLRAHPFDSEGEPFFTPVGRDKILHQSDIARIELALRGELKCRSGSVRRAPAGRRTTKSAAPTSESAWKLAAELLNDPSLLSRSERSKSASKNTGNGPRARG
jgi:hypothetical protein